MLANFTCGYKFGHIFDNNLKKKVEKDNKCGQPSRSPIFSDGLPWTFGGLYI